MRFVNINVTGFDAAKHSALSLIGDARATIEELAALLAGYQVPGAYRALAERLHAEWDAEVEQIYGLRLTPLPSQGELIGAVNELSDPEAIMVCAAGSLPGDLHKLLARAQPQELPHGMRN